MTSTTSFTPVDSGPDPAFPGRPAMPETTTMRHPDAERIEQAHAELNRLSDGIAEDDAVAVGDFISRLVDPETLRGEVTDLLHEQVLSDLAAGEAFDSDSILSLITIGFLLGAKFAELGGHREVAA